MSRNVRVRRSWMFYLERYSAMREDSADVRRSAGFTAGDYALYLDRACNAKKAHAQAWFDRAVVAGELPDGRATYRYVPKADPIERSCSYWERAESRYYVDAANSAFGPCYSDEECERMQDAQDAADAADPPCDACLRCVQGRGEP